MTTQFRMTGYVKATAAWTDVESVTSVIETAAIAPPVTLDNGTGTGQANCLWQSTLAVPAGGSASASLAALPTSVYGGTGTLNMLSSKVVWLTNAGTVPLVVRVPGLVVSSSDPNAGIVLHPGAWALAMSPATGWSSSTDTAVVVRNLSGSVAGSLVIALAGVQ